MMPGVTTFIVRGRRQATRRQGALPVFLSLEILPVAGSAGEVIEVPAGTYLLRIRRIGAQLITRPINKHVQTGRRENERRR